MLRARSTTQCGAGSRREALRSQNHSGGEQVLARATLTASRSTGVALVAEHGRDFIWRRRTVTGKTQVSTAESRDDRERKRQPSMAHARLLVTVDRWPQKNIHRTFVEPGNDTFKELRYGQLRDRYSPGAARTYDCGSIR